MNIRLIKKQTGNPLKYYDFKCSQDESLYDAAEKVGIKLPISCKNGVCHICRGELRSGSVLTGGHNKPVNAAKDGATEIMLCRTWPQSSCEIEVKSVYGPKELPLKKVASQVESIELNQAHVYQIQLSLPAGKLPDFFPGQYLSINLPTREGPAYFSIASRPGLRCIELHIQADPHLESALEIVHYLQTQHEQKNCVSLSLPFGEACLHKTPSKDLIMMAAGTGFSQMKSMIEHLQFIDYRHSISLYWAVRKDEDMYLKALAETWAQQFSNFHFKPIIADINDRQGLDHHDQMSDAVLSDHLDLANSFVFVSGSPKLVFSAMDALTASGLPETQFYSDVLAYTKRSDFS
ncbi:MAG: CDP-4-dehydro-6-deoxyglucose reductase [Oleiphilaceae bacterium]|jgi:CDP-4-dehydro-6-deoxyglucose reductase